MLGAASTAGVEPGPLPVAVGGDVEFVCGDDGLVCASAKLVDNISVAVATRNNAII